LQMLKHLYGLSDREVLDRWVENPYWQFFCGETLFRHRLPMDETTMLRFRQRIGEEGARQILKMTIQLGQDTGIVTPESFRTVVIDTTVMPKAIAYPTDARLVSRCHYKIVTLAKQEGVKFKRTFCRSLETMARKVGRYAHARQFKRMHRVLRKMHHNLINVCIDIQRQKPLASRSQALNHKLGQALRLLDQYQEESVQSRLYSLHEAEVVCITKGK
ncbi:transposase, partial [Kushneria aurantia]